MSKNIKDLIIPFLIGGTIIAGVKFAATHFANPTLAAIIGGVPTGLLAIYFLSRQKAVSYSYEYLHIGLVLVASVAVFHALITRTNMSKNTILIISILTWLSLASLRYHMMKRK